MFKDIHAHWTSLGRRSMMMITSIGQIEATAIAM